MNRDFVLAFFAQLAFTFVFYLLVPTLPIYLSRLKSTDTEIGALIGIFSFSSLILRPFVGRALLRIPEKNLMIAGALLFALSSATYLVAPPFWPLFIVRLFQGIGYAFFLTTGYALVVRISPEEHRGQSLSYFFLAFNLSGALAPSFGMLVINHFSFTHLFFVCSGLSLCSLFITQKLERRPATSRGESPMEEGSFLNRKVLPPSVMNCLCFFIWGAIAAFFPLYAISHGANPGHFYTTYSMMLILGRAVGGKILDLQSKEKIILPCLTTYVIAMIILSFSKTLPLFILVAAIWGIGHSFLMPSLVVYALDRAGSSPGPVMGTFTAFTDLGMSLGPVIMGFVIQWTSYQVMFLCLALIGVINFNYFYFFVRKRGV